MKKSLLAPCALALLASGCHMPDENLEPCNIATSSCQEAVYYNDIRLRGDGWDPFNGLPPIDTITRAQYRKQLEAETAAQKPPNPAAPPQTDPWDVTLQLLKLVTPATSAAQASIDSQVNNVSAFYSSRTRKVTVIDRGSAKRDDHADTTLLAHELVHAFQDNELSGNFGGSTSDGSFSGRCFIEGEATLYEQLTGAELDGDEPHHIDWKRYYRDSWAHSLRQRLPNEKSPYYAVSWFVYPFGADMLTARWLRGGSAAVRELAESFPRRSVDLMAALYGKREGTTAPLSCKLIAPEGGFDLVGLDHFGAMQLYAFLSAASVPEADAWNLALRWRDDAIWVYFDGKERVAMSWRLRLADGDSADAVLSAADNHEGVRAERDGDDVLLVGSNDADQLAAWEGARSCGP